MLSKTVAPIETEESTLPPHTESDSSQNARRAEPEYVKPDKKRAELEYVQPATRRAESEYVQPDTRKVEPEYVQPDTRRSGPEYVQPEDTVVSPETHQKFAIPFGASPSKAKPGHKNTIAMLVNGRNGKNGRKGEYKSPRSARRERNADEYSEEDVSEGVEGRKSIPTRMKRPEDEEEQDNLVAPSSENGRDYDDDYGGVYNDRAADVSDRDEHEEEDRDGDDKEEEDPEEEDVKDELDDKGAAGDESPAAPLSPSSSNVDTTDDAGNGRHLDSSTSEESDSTDHTQSSSTEDSQQTYFTNDHQRSSQPVVIQHGLPAAAISEKMRPYFYYIDSRSYVHRNGKHLHKEILEKWSKAELSKRLRPALIHDSTGTHWVEPHTYEIPVLLPMKPGRKGRARPTAAPITNIATTTSSNLSPPQPDPDGDETGVNAFQASMGAVTPESPVSFGGNVLRAFLRHRYDNKKETKGYKSTDPTPTGSRQETSTENPEE